MPFEVNLKSYRALSCTHRLTVRQIIGVFLLRTKVVECCVVHNFSKYFILFPSFVELLSNLCFFCLLKCEAIILRKLCVYWRLSVDFQPVAKLSKFMQYSCADNFKVDELLYYMTVKIYAIILCADVFKIEKLLLHYLLLSQWTMRHTYIYCCQVSCANVITISCWRQQQQ